MKQSQNQVEIICNRFSLKKAQLARMISVSHALPSKNPDSTDITRAILAVFPFVTQSMLTSLSEWDKVIDVPVNADMVLTPYQRIEAICYCERYNIQAFSKVVGIPSAVFAQYKIYNHNISAQRADAICAAIPTICRDWLLSGQGMMYTDGRMAPLAIVTDKVEVLVDGVKYSISKEERKKVYQSEPEKKVLQEMMRVIEEQKKELAKREADMAKRESAIAERENALRQQELDLAKREEQLAIREQTAARNLSHQAALASSIELAMKNPHGTAEPYNTDDFIDRLNNGGAHPDIK